MAMGVMSMALVSLMGLFPVVLGNIQTSSERCVQLGVVNQAIGAYLQMDFSKLPTTRQETFFDSDGAAVAENDAHFKLSAEVSRVKGLSDSQVDAVGQMARVTVLVKSLRSQSSWNYVTLLANNGR